MTIRDMITSLAIQVDKVNSLVTADFLDEHYKFYLDLAVNQFVLNCFTGNNSHRAAFETSVENIEALRLLKSSVNYSVPSIDPIDGSFTHALPANLAFLIALTGKSTGTCPRNIDFKFTQYDDLSSSLRDPFNKPKDGKVLYVVHKDSINMYATNVSQVSNVILYYIKTPLSILKNVGNLFEDTDEYFEISSIYHPKIVTLAVSMMLEGVSDPRYSSFQNQINKID